MKFRRRSFEGFEVAYLDCSGRAFAKHTHDEFVISANVVGREKIWLERHLGLARAVAFEKPVIRAETHTQAISQFGMRRSRAKSMTPR